MEENKIYETSDYSIKEEPWCPYNGIKHIGNYGKHRDTGELIGPITAYRYDGKGCTIYLEDDSKMLLDKNYVLGYMYQKYENGEPVGEPYFEEE